MSTHSQERVLYMDLARRLREGQPVAMATLVRAWGSTPREVGAKMLVDPQGRIAGTIGGGCGEAEVWQETRDVLAGGPPRTVHVDLTEDIESDSGKVCGGRFDVLVEGLDPAGGALALADAIARGSEPDRELALMVVLGPTGPPAWKDPSTPPPEGKVPTGLRLALVEPGGLVGTLGTAEADRQICGLARQALRKQAPSVVTVEVDGMPHDVFVDVLAAPPELVIAGAGHIARPLCRMAALCGYRVTIVDDRPEYADPVYFPDAAEVICRSFTDTFRELDAGPRTHVVLVTRGHKHDEECLRELIGKSPAYIGMIGSRRRTKAVFTELEAEGVDPAWLDRVHAPIGVDIAAETPEEIAVSILGELISLRRGGRAPSLSLRAGS